MCGFIGVYGSAASKYQPYFSEALATLKHRGPDATGIYFAPDDYCLLGHQRLSILDLSSRADQPMYFGDRVLVYNGEIYNHLKLRLGLQVTTYLTHSDTETLGVGLNNCGSNFLNLIDGMFAGAYYNSSEHTLTVFRDSLGIKPLYYLMRADGTFIFASEIKAILKLTADTVYSCNKRTLFNYLTYENYPQGDSFFTSIKLLRPGEIISVSNNGSKSSFINSSTKVVNEAPSSNQRDNFFSDFTSTPSRLGRSSRSGEILARSYNKLSKSGDLEAITERVIRQSVSDHLLSDVACGVYLSGGIDSSLVASLAAEIHSNIIGVTGYFDVGDSFYDERELARLVAKKMGINLLEVKIKETDLINNLDSIVWALDEPRMGMGCFSQYMVAREASMHCKVFLAGHGGDEFFAGYPLFKAFRVINSFRTVTELSRKEWTWLVNLGQEILVSRLLSFAPKIWDLKITAGDNSLGESTFTTKNTYDALGQLFNYYKSCYLPGLLVVEDKISMAHSLETRVPLCSNSIFNWSEQIPVEEKLAGGNLKSHLKKVARKYLPAEVISGPKRGFPTPLRLWFRQEPVKSFVFERLLGNTNSPIYHIIPKRNIESLLNQHSKLRLPFVLDERRSHKIWMLLCLESWFRQYKVSL